MFKEAKHHKEADALVRYEPEIAVGLKEEEVLAREKAGLSNKSNVRVDKPYWKIFTDNIFTVFNITLYAIGLLFLITSLLLNHFGHNEVVAKYFGISKYGFLGPATIKMVIGIIEEYDDDPFLVAGTSGKGRALASAVDCAHHGAAPTFLNWEYSSLMYANMVKWICGAI